MKIGLIGAMPQEIVLLVENMTNKQEEKKHHLTFVTGELCGVSVVLVESGIGKVNSAIATTLLITHYHVDKVINTGSAGSLAGHQIGDVVVSDVVRYHDVDATAFGYEMGQVPQMPAVYRADETLTQLAVSAIQKGTQRAHVGEIVSSDSFIGKQGQLQRIQEQFPTAQCTEMEGASIAQACHVLGVPFVIVRAISDSADTQAAMTFDEFIEIAGEKSAYMVMEMMRELV